MIKLKHILQEDDFESKFEKVPFGHWDEIRAMLKGNPSHEVNTDFEREFLSLIKKWTVGVDLPTVAKKLIEHLDVIKEGARKYPELFRPSTQNGTELYRGLRFLSPTVEDSLLKKEESDFIEVDMDGETYWKCQTPISYKPRIEVQSWTTDKTVPKRFSRKSGVLIMTNQDDDFYFSQKFINVVFQKSMNATADDNESETLHLGTQYNGDVFIVISDAHYRRKFTDGDAS